MVEPASLSALVGFSKASTARPPVDNLRRCIVGGFKNFQRSCSCLPILPAPPTLPRQAAHLWPSVRPPVNNLRRCIERTPTKCLQVLVLLVQVGKPKVSDLQREARPTEICMSDVASVCKLTGTSVSASLASRTPPVLHYSQPDFQLRVSNVLDEPHAWGASGAECHRSFFE